MFLHSPQVKQRIVATIILALGTLIPALFYYKVPIDVNSFTFWFVTGVSVTVIGQGVIVWRATKNLPRPELPDPARWSGPNAIPPGRRLINSLGSIALIVWGAYGLYRNDIPMPTRYGTDHVSGLATWFLSGAMICAAANLGSVVIDHYDRRNNELSYANFAAITQWLGWALFIGAWFQSLFQGLP